MRRNVLLRAALLGATWVAPALAQPVDPMEGVVPVSPSEAAPPAAVSSTPPAAAPPPGPAPTATPQAAPPPAAPPAAPTTRPAPAPPEPPPEKRTTVTTFGIGPTYFATTGTGRELSRPGVMLQAATRIPFEDNLGFGLRLAWGLTEFRRFEGFTRAGYRIGEWTTQAYKDVYEFAAEPDDWRLFRWMGAFFGFVALIFPYVAAGLVYVVSPVAPTTYLETDFTLNYDFGTDRAGSGPYFKLGAAFVGYLHPRTDKLLGGLGPTAGLGVRLGGVDLGIHGTWLPPSLHGESPGERTNVYIGSLSIGVSR